MIFQTFLRAEGDPGNPGDDPKPDKPLGDPKPDAEPQDGDRPDPDKPEPDKPEPDKGLSAEEKAELESLRKDKETSDKRISDAQREFHSSRDELKGLKEKVDVLTKPPDQKPEDAYADDTVIQDINRKIEAYEERNYDTSPLVQLKGARVRELNLEKRLDGLETRTVQSDEVGKFLMDNPGVKDLTETGETKGMLTSRGEKVSFDTAYHYNRGKNYDKDFDEAVKGEVAKQLEVLKKGGGARGQEGGFEEPPEADKEEKAYADFLTNPAGDAAIK